MDVLRSLLVSLEIFCSRCTVYDSYRTLLFCVWDGNSVTATRGTGIVDPLCHWVISVPALFSRHAVCHVLAPGVEFCGPGYTRLREHA